MSFRYNVFRSVDTAEKKELVDFVVEDDYITAYSKVMRYISKLYRHYGIKPEPYDQQRKAFFAEPA